MVSKELSTQLRATWHTRLEIKHERPSSSRRWTEQPVSDDATFERGGKIQSSEPVTDEGILQRGGASGTVSFFFDAPATTNMYDDFQLAIKCVNRSPSARNFSVTYFPTEQNGVDKGQHSVTKVDGAFSTSRLGGESTRKVFCHTPHIRMVAVPSGVSFDAAMDFRALNTGILDLGSLILTDLDTNAFIDVIDLPAIICFEASKGAVRQGPSKYAMQVDDRFLSSAFDELSGQIEEV